MFCFSRSCISLCSHDVKASRPPVRGGSFALPFLRTGMFFQNIPVFRSAYFPIPHRPTFGAPVFRSAYSASRNARASAAFAASIKPHCGLFSKTLDLQVRSAHPPPAHRNDPSGHSGVPLGLFGKPKRSSSSRFAASGGRGELRSPLHPPLPPPHAGQAGAKGTERAPWLPYTRRVSAANLKHERLG